MLVGLIGLNGTTDFTSFERLLIYVVSYSIREQVYLERLLLFFLFLEAKLAQNAAEFQNSESRSPV